MTVAVI